MDGSLVVAVTWGFGWLCGSKINLLTLVYRLANLNVKMKQIWLILREIF